MLKIGEFSKLAHITVKALRYYEAEGILMPASIDEWTGYRLYETDQLETAGAIKSYRQLGFTIDEIKSILSGQCQVIDLLHERENSIREELSDLSFKLSIIHSILEDNDMKYKVTEKTVPECIVYYSETTLQSNSDIMTWIPSLGEEVMKLNPDLKCAEPEYEFCEFLDNEYREKDVHVRHSQAVTAKGVEGGNIKFKTLPETKVLSIYHKGPYETLNEAYGFIVKYANNSGYEIASTPRECYIDGIWNKENPADWLTEIQLPIK